MAAQRFVAFDLGAESGRAVVGTLDGGKLTLDERHRFANPTGRLRGCFHWNLLGQWEELKTGLRKAAGGSGGGQGKLAGIGVDTWGVDFGLIGKGGEILGNPVMYRDSRTDGVMEKTFNRVSREKIYAATGIQFMQLNTLFQLEAMREAKSPLLESAETLLFMPDLFAYLFSGKRQSEVSIASTSQMYDPRKKTWAKPMLEELGLPTRLLAPIVPSGTIVGNLLEDVARECEVESVPVIAPGGHDTASAVAAVPADEKDRGWCYISSGTWSLMGVELDEPIITDKALQYGYTNEIGVGGRVRFLKNIMGLWLVQECRRQWAKQGHEHSYAELTEMATGAKGFGAVVDLDHGPFLSPGEMVQKIERFCAETGQRSPSGIGEFVRVCLESLALTYRRTLTGLEEILGRRIGVIHIVGGGSRNELLNQMTADACGRTVIAGPVEATAAGNVLVQAMAVGQIKSLADARAIVRNSFDVKRFEPRDTGAWDRAYERYENVVRNKNKSGQ